MYTLLFWAFQLVAGFVVDVLWRLLVKSPDEVTTKMIVTMVVFSVVTIICFLAGRWAEVSLRWLGTRPWVVLAWSVVASLGAIVPSLWLQEQMPKLPDLMAEEFGMMMSDYWSYLAIGLLAPVAEEIVFRGAVLKSLLQWQRERPWMAIAVSALLFAVAHLNPAQMPHAFLIGLLLGWMYWRTGSIVPGIAYHWCNNSVAYIIYRAYPDPDIQLIDIFKGSQQHMLMALGFSLLILLPALYQLHLWMKRAE